MTEHAEPNLDAVRLVVTQKRDNCLAKIDTYATELMFQEQVVAETRGKLQRMQQLMNDLNAWLDANPGSDA